MDLRNAFLLADATRRGAIRRAPPGRNLLGASRVSTLRYPAYGLNEAPAAFYKTPYEYLLGAGGSANMEGLRFATPTFGRHLHTINKATSGSASAPTAHVDDVLGCGQAGAPPISREELGP